MHRSSGLQGIGIEMRVGRRRESELGSAGMRGTWERVGIWNRVGLRVEMGNDENCMRSECGNEQ